MIYFDWCTYFEILNIFSTSDFFFYMYGVFDGISELISTIFVLTDTDRNF